ncbi:MAG: diaminopimelate decarboxylase [bacterium]
MGKKGGEKAIKAHKKGKKEIMGFEYIKGRLCCDGIRIDEIAKKVETPFYLYSKEAIENNFREYKEAFSRLSPIICYAAKANSNISILKLLAELGAGCDVASAGELFLARKAGISSSKIVFNGNGKTEDDIKMAIKEKVFLIIADSIDELFLIDNITKEKINVGIRINPGIEPKTHPYVATGLEKSKFGVRISGLKDAIGIIKKMKNVNLVCLSSHIGSQITELSPFVENAEKLVALAFEIGGIEYINIGGGLGIPYNNENFPGISQFAKEITSIIKGSSFKLILEPGRSIVGNSGCLVTRVLYLKETKTKKFIIVDAGMNDLMRPALYNSFHRILQSELREQGEIIADIVGPLCEDGDFLARERKMSAVSSSDLLCIMDAGAYSFSMSSNYNGRPRCPEVMVIDKKPCVIRKRETFKDLIRN